MYEEVNVFHEREFKSGDWKKTMRTPATYTADSIEAVYVDLSSEEDYWVVSFYEDGSRAVIICKKELKKLAGKRKLFKFHFGAFWCLRKSYGLIEDEQEDIMIDQFFDWLTDKSFYKPSTSFNS